MFRDASPSAQTATPLAIIKLQRGSGPFASILLNSTECTRRISHYWDALNNNSILVLMSSYFYDNCDKSSPAHRNIHLQFPNRVCRNLNNTNEQMIKVLLPVLNKERSHCTNGKGQLLQSQRTELPQEISCTHNKHDGKSAAFHLVCYNKNGSPHFQFG